jgi:hypothetical protein
MRTCPVPLHSDGFNEPMTTADCPEKRLSPKPLFHHWFACIILFEAALLSVSFAFCFRFRLFPFFLFLPPGFYAACALARAAS